MKKKQSNEKLIPIDERSKIQLEDNNYILYRKNGKNWRVDGYFPTLASLLQDWVVNAPAHASARPSTLLEVVQIIQKAEKHIEQLIRGK